MVVAQFYGIVSLMVRWNQSSFNLLDSVVWQLSWATGTVLIANVYMPTDTAQDRRNDNEFNGILQEIIDMKDGLGIENIVIGGDFNTDFSRCTSYHTSS